MAAAWGKVSKTCKYIIIPFPTYHTAIERLIRKGKGLPSKKHSAEKHSPAKKQLKKWQMTNQCCQNDFIAEFMFVGCLSWPFYPACFFIIHREREAACRCLHLKGFIQESVISLQLSSSAELLSPRKKESRNFFFSMLCSKLYIPSILNTWFATK